MAVPENKTELLQAIETNFSKLIDELKNVPIALVLQTTMEGHVKDTSMSVTNLVSYLIGWNELVIKWLEHDAAGQPIEFPETGFKWNELGRLAQKFYQDYSGILYPELLERLIAAKTRIVSIVDSYDNDKLYHQPWYEKWTMGRMIQFNTSSPYANARTRLRKWLKSQLI